MKRYLIHSTTKKRGERIIENGFKESNIEERTWRTSECDQVYFFDIEKAVKNEIESIGNSVPTKSEISQALRRVIEEAMFQGMIRGTLDKLEGGKVGNEAMVLFFEAKGDYDPNELESIISEDVSDKGIISNTTAVQIQTDFTDEVINIMPAMYFEYDELTGYLALSSRRHVNRSYVSDIHCDMMDSISKVSNFEDIEFMLSKSYDERYFKNIGNSNFDISTKNIIDIVKELEEEFIN